VIEAWVVNASPLILLARIDALYLLERLAPRIAVPDAATASPARSHRLKLRKGAAVRDECR